MLSPNVSATLSERIRLLGFRLLSCNRPPHTARRRILAAEALEPRIVLATIIAGTPFSFSDADGDRVAAKLKGPGSVNLTLDDPDRACLPDHGKDAHRFLCPRRFEV